MVIASASLFRFFEGLSITNRLAQKVVTLLSSLTFGVYLIHEQPEIRAFLWEKLLRPGNYVQSPFLILFLLGIALFVFCYAHCSNIFVIEYRSYFQLES